MLSLGMLGAAACSSCSPSTNSDNSNAALAPASYTCGPNTHRSGNQCVGNTTTTTGTGGAPKPLNTSGNN
jgi:hypothetical protein